MERIRKDRRAFTVAALSGGTLMLPQIGRGQSSSNTLNKKELANLVLTAKTAEDHHRLADHFRAVAARHELEAEEHLELAAKYKKDPNPTELKMPGAPNTASHCLTFAEHCRKAARVMTEMAEMHEQMAKNVK